MKRIFMVTLLIAASLTSCERGLFQSSADASGLSASELATPLPEPHYATSEEVEAMKLGAEHYTSQLAAVQKRDIKEWQRRIDSLHAGMFMFQVEKVLPHNSISTSTLWAYHGILSTNKRQMHLWALDAEFAVAVEVDFSGDDAWLAEGSPNPRLLRHSDRITARPILLRHKGILNEWGHLEKKDCWPF